MGGKVYLVGAGPVDPGLLTLKGLEAIKAADCIIYDFLPNSRLLEHAGAGVETIYVGKKGSEKTLPQEDINRLIIKKARSGKTVVRVPGEALVAFDDFGQDEIGDFPARWNTNGSGEVVTIGGLSGHAGQDLLVKYAMNVRGSVNRIFLVHGEEKQAGILRGLLKDRKLDQVHYPALHESAMV